MPPKIRCLAERHLPLATVRGRQQATDIFNAAKRRRDGQSNSSSTANQCAKRLKRAVKSCRFHRTVRVGTVIAEEIDQGNLLPALLRYAAGCHKCQRDFTLCHGGAGIKNRLGDFHDVLGHGAMADRVFSDKLEQGRVLEVVPAWE